MDKTKYEYHPVDGRPNVLVEYPIGQVPAVTDPGNVIIAYTCVKQVAEALILKKPNWTFVLSGINYGPPSRAMRVEVYEGGERLGYFIRGYARGGGVGVDIHSRSIAAERQRSNSTCTTDVKRAVKIIEKHFKRKDLTTLLREQVDNSYGVVAAKSGAIFSRANSLWNAIGAKALDVAIDHWDYLTPHFLAAGIDADKVREYPEARTRQKHASNINGAAVGGSGWFVTIRDDVYYFTRRPMDPASIKMYTTETLPASYRVDIGMLKLVDDGTLVPEVGVKVNATSFFLVREKE